MMTGMSDMPEFRLPHRLPHRPFAIEAMIAAAIAYDPLRNGVLSIRWISRNVETALPWAQRTEIHNALQRMVSQGRIIPQRDGTRVIPLYALPDAHASNAAIPSPAS
jgi:hypothetical protein